MDDIRIAVKRYDRETNTHLIKVKGYVDLVTHKELQQIIDHLLEKKICRMIVDLENVTYISSAGWRTLFAGIRKVRPLGGDIKIVKLSRDILQVLQLLEFDSILNVYKSEKEALASFKDGEPEESEVEDYLNTRVIPNPFFASVC